MQRHSTFCLQCALKTIKHAGAVFIRQLTACLLLYNNFCHCKPLDVFRPSRTPSTSPQPASLTTLKHPLKFLMKIRILLQSVDKTSKYNRFPLFTIATRFVFYTKAIIRLNHYKRTSRKSSDHLISIQPGCQRDIGLSLTYVYSGLA